MPVLSPPPILTYDGNGYLVGRGGIRIPYGATPPPPPPPPNSPYRPITLTWDNALSNSAQIAALNAQGGGDAIHLPTDATLVKWPYSNPDGALLNVWLETLTSTQIGVLPEFTKPDGSPWPYLWETKNGFKRDGTYYYTMIVPRRGILGLGPNTVLAPNASSFSQGQQPRPTANGGAGFFDIDGTEKVGCQMSIMRCATANAYFGNFEIRGRSYGGVAYSCIATNAGIWAVENIFFNGAHAGFMNAPNGESGALTAQKGTAPMVRLFSNCEIECRDSTGARQGSSPWMWNNLTGCTVRDIYAHHSSAGMPTAWNCKSTVAAPMSYTRIRSEWNGAGGGNINGSCANWELVQTDAGAPIEWVGPGTLIANWTGTTDSTQGTGNSGLHMSGGSNVARARINVRNVGIDKGPRPRTGAGTPTLDTLQQGLHVLTFQLFGYTPQWGLDIHRYDASGTEITVYQYGTVTAP